MSSENFSQQKNLEVLGQKNSRNGVNSYNSSSLAKRETVNTITSEPITKNPSNDPNVKSEKNSQPKPQKPNKRPKSFWTWQLIWWTVATGFGITGGAALLWLLVNPPQPNCQQISALSADGERLYCAHQAAESQDLEELEQALALVESWSEDHPLYQLGQQMTGEWTKLIISIANQKIREGNLQAALDTVAKIPKTSPAYSRVEEAIAGWKKQWAEGQSLYDKSQTALKAQDWNKASAYALAMSKLDNVHWQDIRFKELLQRMAVEKKAWEMLKDARNLIYEETVQEYAEAITLARKIDSNLYIREKADKDIQNWIRSLIKIADKRIEEKDLKGAIAAIEYIPSDHKLKKEAEDLILLGHAKAATWNKSVGGSQISNMAALVEGKAAASQITSNSPYYQEAQTQIKQLKQQLDDLTYIQLANAIASVGQPATFKLAIDQAQMVSQGQVLRIPAQTLIAGWRKDILRIEDRPYITLAKELSEQKTVDSYNSAIKQASYVALERPLRIEAQTLIAEWNKRVQIIEDSPLLAEARALAKEGNLGQAIDLAYQIESGRALYEEAQDEIYKWTTELQIAQDRPILNQAYSLADQGSLTAAINTAYQIGYGRALYYEAQGAISRWAAERDAIWAAQQAEEARRRRQYAPAPAPSPQYYAPAPSPQYYAPAPSPQYYAPAPSPQYYAPAPSPQYY
ncbi:MAG: hypothetical protein QNJ68_23565, partial [Microcoleaceae cyanobacterium MO_207.B10]|nr:hypothetical protein [Microcoleaceae cyanobacterium MO_207.B10]